MTSIKKHIPWWLKIIIKIILSRLPVPYALWKKIGLFELGEIYEPGQTLENFLKHAGTAAVLDRKSGIAKLKGCGSGYTFLELGPGDALFNVVVAKSLGASKSYLIDVGYYANAAMSSYAALIDYLATQGFPLPANRHWEDVTELLQDCQADYLTEGLSSLAGLPPNSVDYAFSSSVLEHIEKEDFVAFISALHRAMKTNGVSFHSVDLKDHLGGKLNNLRFNDATWESSLFRKSGFYTNRIRFHEMLAIFEDVGFDCQLTSVVRWDTLPTPRAQLDTAFQGLSEDDLLVSGFDVVLQRK